MTPNIHKRFDARLLNNDIDLKIAFSFKRLRIAVLRALGASSSGKLLEILAKLKPSGNRKSKGLVHC